MINKNNSQMDYNMDLLRILASLMVIVIHVSAYNFLDTPTKSIEWLSYDMYDSIVRSAVPIFLMISGAFFLNDKIQNNLKKLYTKNIFKLVLVFVIWSFIYATFCVFTKRIDSNNFLGSIIAGHFHLWFIPIIIGIYIISPFIYRFVKNSDEKIFKYFLIIFISATLLKTISYLQFLPCYEYITLFLGLLPIDIICKHYSYFILGYFLYNYDVSKKFTKTIYILSVISIFLCFIGCYILSRYLGYNNSDLMSGFSIFTVIEAIGLFLFFKNHSFDSKSVFSKRVADIANCTLGIYMIHMLVLYILFDCNLIQIRSFNTILSVPIISILIFVISLVIVYLIKKIKFIGKWLF